MISNYISRPITVLGAGVLGRRIATAFAAGGYTVHIRDPSQTALDDASRFVDANKAKFGAFANTARPAGRHGIFTEIQQAVKSSWLVVEAVPEKLPLKISTFGEVDRCAPADCVIASNSSSFKSREIMGEVSEERKRRVLNMHFTMPPAIRTVELMTSGQTEESLFPFLSGVLSECGMIPVTARKESTGLIFNRLWAAMKREIMLILSEEVSSPKEIDVLFEQMFQTSSSMPPCRMMDQVGLDTVAFIEDHYIQERGLDSKMTVDWLRDNYIEQGKLGQKSEKGGLYPKQDTPHDLTHQEIYVLDVGLGSRNKISQVTTSGRVLRFNLATKTVTTIVSEQVTPDGIAVSRSAGRIFWTSMGRNLSARDGSVLSANLDGSDIRPVVEPGAVVTPKQLVIDDKAQKIYFCDREGMGVHRVNFDGSSHELLVSTGEYSNPEHLNDMQRWCVGIALDPVRGHFYWTQKGSSKAGKGRIFRARIDMPAGATAENRPDIELVLDKLPEPIDLEIDPLAGVLYWTDRGEYPTGCSLNKADITDLNETRSSHRILARQFHEPIGLKVDSEKKLAYVCDMGGSIYQVTPEEKKLLFQDDGCYTGLCL